jgi:uncharacterized protein YecE (DUF72 family)
VGRYRVGTTSFTYEDWVGPFYPEGCASEERLARYAKVFDLVEVDSTFYRMPSPEVSARWAAETPPGFLLTAKLSRRITHEAQLVGVEDMVGAFLARMLPVKEAGKLGALLAQFPPSFSRKRGAALLEPFLDVVPASWPLAVEFRNDSWFVPETYAALRQRNRALVWLVTHEGMTPPEVTADFLYARLAGPDRIFTTFDRVQRDMKPAMQELHARLEQEGKDADRAFLLCSNHFEGHGPGTAARLCEVLGLPAAELARAKEPLTGKPQRSLADFA